MTPDLAKLLEPYEDGGDITLTRQEFDAVPTRDIVRSMPTDPVGTKYKVFALKTCWLLCEAKKDAVIIRPIKVRG